MRCKRYTPWASDATPQRGSVVYSDANQARKHEASRSRFSARPNLNAHAPHFQILMTQTKTRTSAGISHCVCWTQTRLHRLQVDETAFSNLMPLSFHYRAGRSGAKLESSLDNRMKGILGPTNYFRWKDCCILRLLGQFSWMVSAGRSDLTLRGEQEMKRRKPHQVTRAQCRWESNLLFWDDSEKSSSIVAFLVWR